MDRGSRAAGGGVMPALGLPGETFKNSDNRPADSASLKPDTESENFKFERPDWVMFRSVGTLSQKAGVPVHRLRRLVLKELVDNALDAGAAVTLRQEGSMYIIEDDGPGFTEDAAGIARLFSINRPMMSSKLWRLPKRGALGNGLRVVAGAVLASGGGLAVVTGNKAHTLFPRDDGTTDVESTDLEDTVGTCIQIVFGAGIPFDGGAMTWAQDAIAMAAGETYGGKPSPFWYDADHFFELLQAAGVRPVRDLVAQLDGCSGAKAGTIAADFRGMHCRDLDRAQAVALLGAARSHARPVNPLRLGAASLDARPGHYAVERGTVQMGAHNPKADIPFVVEAWASHVAGSDDASLQIFVNRTPVTGAVRAHKEKKEISIWGPGLSHRFESERGAYRLAINVIAPHVPITTDGKEPDLSPFVSQIVSALQVAIKKAKRSAPAASRAKRTQKDIVLDRLSEAVMKVSGDGEYRFSVRQLFYAVRPHIIAELGAEPDYKYFERIITEYEADYGDIVGLYRDPRGTLYHPHTGREIALGTMAVESYERPAWTFNKVLYIEKEGFLSILKAAKWPERHDCALLTSKGFSTRAVRDFLDLLAEDAQEDITVFAVHDADAYGTMIYQTLQEETRARAKRKVKIINLGLDPWEAEAMGLEPENRESKEIAAVASYIKERPDGARWADWLQRQRFELNAMTMPQFIAWLDRKIAEHPVPKVIPPIDVVVDEIYGTAESIVREDLLSALKRESGFEDMVTDTMAGIVMPGAERIEAELPAYLNDNEAAPWSAWAQQTGEEVARGAA